MSTNSTKAPIDRMPPHNLDAERCVIASAVIDKSAMAAICRHVDAESFYSVDHQIIFAAVKRIYDSGKPVDVVILAEELRRTKLYDEVGGTEGIATILNAVPSSYHAEYYARIVREKSHLRSLIRLAQHTMDRAFADGNSPIPGEADIDAICSDVSAKASEIMRTGRASIGMTVGESAGEVVERLGRKDKSEHLLTNVAEIDRLMGGLVRGCMHLIAGDAGSGKSALWKQLVRGIAAQGLPVGVVSIEETGRKIATNMLASVSGVRNRDIRFGNVGEPEIRELIDAQAALATMPITCIDDAYMLDDVVSAIHYLASEKKCVVVVVDHLHCIATRGRDSSEEVRIAGIGKALKHAFKQANVAGIALGQVNRTPVNEIPTLAVLRGSGQLGSDSDVVLYLQPQLPDASDGAAAHRDDPYPVVIWQIKHKDEAKNVRLTMDFHGNTQLFSGSIYGNTTSARDEFPY